MSTQLSNKQKWVMTLKYLINCVAPFQKGKTI